MKNLTSAKLIVQQSNGYRFVLPAADYVPTIKVVQGRPLGELDGVTVCTLTTRIVDFGGIILDHRDAPFIVNKEVFNALPCDAIDFITPDLGSSAIRNDGEESCIITQFISKVMAARPPVV